MTSTIFLSVAALLYTILIAIVYFSKPRIGSLENKIYKYLILVSLLSLVSELSLTIIPYETVPAFYNIMLKVYLVCCFSWIATFVAYIFIVGKNETSKSSFTTKKLPIMYLCLYVVIGFNC